MELETTHFIWLNPPLPTWAKDNIASFRRHNGDCLILHETPKLLLPRYRDLYEMAKDLRTKSDLLRFSILETMGGVYFDCDWFHYSPMPLQDMNGKIAYYEAVKGIPCIAALASAPGAPGWQTVAKHLRKFTNALPCICTRAFQDAVRERPEYFCQLNGRFGTGPKKDFYLYCKAHNLTPHEHNIPDVPTDLVAVHFSMNGERQVDLTVKEKNIDIFMDWAESE